MVLGLWASIPGRKRNFSVLHCIQRSSAAHPPFWPELIGGSSPGTKDRGVELTTFIHPMQWLRMCEAVPSLFRISFWCAAFLSTEITRIATINQSIHWRVQNAVIPCRSQEPLPFLPVIHFFLPLLSADNSSILPHFIQPSISWSTSWSCCFQIHIQYSFGNPIFFHSLYMSKPT